jgi:hypothetical protein
MQPKFGLILISCFVSVLFLAGCAGLEKKGATTPALLEPQAILKFADLPIPTYSFETQGVRVGMLKYQGKANPEQIVAFYKEQMTMYNWDLLNIVEYGDRLLNFDRDNETCVITLSPQGSRIIISVALGPKGQAIPKREAKPVK